MWGRGRDCSPKGWHANASHKPAPPPAIILPNNQRLAFPATLPLQSGFPELTPAISYRSNEWPRWLASSASLPWRLCGQNSEHDFYFFRFFGVTAFQRGTNSTRKLGPTEREDRMEQEKWRRKTEEEMVKKKKRKKRRGGITREYQTTCGRSSTVRLVPSTGKPSPICCGSLHGSMVPSALCSQTHVSPSTPIGPDRCSCPLASIMWMRGWG